MFLQDFFGRRSDGNEIEEAEATSGMGPRFDADTADRKRIEANPARGIADQTT